MQRMGPINNNGYLPNKQQSPTAEEQPAGGSRSESATNSPTGGQEVRKIYRTRSELPGTQDFSFVCHLSACLCSLF